MKHLITALVVALVVTSLLLPRVYAEPDTKLLFIGNSFTFGYGSAVKYYRPNTITDLNKEGVGGVPALVKSFTVQAALNYDVYIQTRGGAALDYHLANKRELIGSEAWDKVVMHGFSTLDSTKPGDSTMLIDTTVEMSAFLQSLNPNVDIFLTSTWSRADLIYQPGKHWSGTPIAKMANDVRAGYDKAAAAAPGVKSVNGVGEAWTHAMKLGIADPNPYDGIAYGKISLWSWDNYHASNYGYYLEALVVFGNITGIDPRALGEFECSGYELGMSGYQIKMLQQAAFEQLKTDRNMKPGRVLPNQTLEKRCK